MAQRARSSDCGSSMTMTGVMNQSVHEAGGSILLVSQFTLFASTKREIGPLQPRSAAGNRGPAIRTIRCQAGAGLGQADQTGEFGSPDARQPDQ